MIKNKEKRLFKTFKGHFFELMSVFERTTAHKLPGSKGALREEAVSKFISNWIPRRYTVPTNVFATTKSGKEFPAEIDLVIHDSNSGGLWRLDSDGVNSIATREEIKLIMEIKSTLDKETFEKTCNSIKEKIDKFDEVKIPPLVLMAYKTESEVREIILNPDVRLPFNVFILLDKGAFFERSPEFKEIRLGIEKGLSPERIREDPSSIDKILLDYCVKYIGYPNYEQYIGSSPESSALLSLAVIATQVTSGDDVTQSLLAACKDLMTNSND